MPNATYSCLDIGDTFIKLVKMNLIDGKLCISGTYKTKTRGIEDGVIYAKSEFQACVNDLISKAAQDSKTEIKDLIVVLPSSKLEVIRQQTEVTVTSLEHVISSNDYNALLSKANKDYETRRPDMELFSLRPACFYIDNISIGVRNPINFNGEIIKLDGILTSLPKDLKRNIKKAIEELGYKVIDINVQPIATQAALFGNVNNKYRAGILDIGGNHTSISFIFNNILMEYIDLNIGTEYINIELSKNFNIDIDEANYIFEKYANAKVESNDDIVVYTTSTGKELTEAEINKVVEAAFNTIFIKLANESENPLKFLADSPIYVTGGGANVRNINMKINDSLNKECLIKKYHKIGSEHTYTTAIGGIIDYLLKEKLISTDNI